MTLTVQGNEPATAADTEVLQPEDAQAPRRPSLSPSRAADFKTCPLLYRFRTIDRLPEKKSRAAVRGTLVHAVLEKLYDLPAAQRTVETARTLVEPAWAELREEPGIAELFEPAPDESGEATPDAAAEKEGLQAWLASAGELVETYFRLEDPTRIQPHGREELVEVTLPDGPGPPRLRRPARRRPEWRAAGRGLQDRRRPPGGLRGQGAVPDEVLRA